MFDSLKFTSSTLRYDDIINVETRYGTFPSRPYRQIAHVKRECIILLMHVLKVKSFECMSLYGDHADILFTKEKRKETLKSLKNVTNLVN